MKAELISFTDHAPEIRHFVFQVPEAGELKFVPGQFVSLVGEGHGKEITRAYSLAAPPRGDDQFEICLNLVEDGAFSPKLFDMLPGDTVEFKGILGTFGWRPPLHDAVLVATGTGIVPFRAMLQSLYAEGTEQSITLIYGTRYPRNLLWVDEFESLARANPRFQFIPTVTRPGPEWSGLMGRVQPLLEEALNGRTDMQVYVCGLKEMVDSVRTFCKERGMDRRQIIYEKYD